MDVLLLHQYAFVCSVSLTIFLLIFLYCCSSGLNLLACSCLRFRGTFLTLPRFLSLAAFIDFKISYDIECF